MGVRQTGHGRPRPGSGRPKGPDSDLRRNKVAFMVTDGELGKLQRLAEERTLPVGTVADEIVERALRRRS